MGNALGSPFADLFVVISVHSATGSFSQEQLAEHSLRALDQFHGLPVDTDLIKQVWAKSSCHRYPAASSSTLFQRP